MSAVVVALVWRQFICKACGLIYDEAKGDADSGLAPARASTTSRKTGPARCAA